MRARPAPSNEGAHTNLIVQMQGPSHEAQLQQFRFRTCKLPCWREPSSGSFDVGFLIVHSYDTVFCWVLLSVTGIFLKREKVHLAAFQTHRIAYRLDSGLGLSSTCEATLLAYQHLRRQTLLQGLSLSAASSLMDSNASVSNSQSQKHDTVSPVSLWGATDVMLIQL